ncbi:hypothetical protein ACTJJJ_28635 [Dyadobacter sp. 22481]
MYFREVSGIQNRRLVPKDEEKVKNYVKAYQSKEVEAAAAKVFQGGAIKGW